MSTISSKQLLRIEKSSTRGCPAFEVFLAIRKNLELNGVKIALGYSDFQFFANSEVLLIHNAVNQ